jgi:hypothetical protein
MGIIATETFPTSCLERLYVESREPPLPLQRNILLCRYAAKLATQPHHPSHGAITFYPLQQVRIKRLNLWVSGFANFCNYSIFVCHISFPTDPYEFHLDILHHSA